MYIYVCVCVCYYLQPTYVFGCVVTHVACVCLRVAGGERAAVGSFQQQKVDWHLVLDGNAPHLCGP